VARKYFGPEKPPPPTNKICLAAGLNTNPIGKYFV